MKITKKFIWDYDVAKMDFSDPVVIRWYLKRKIDFCDWDVVDRKTLEKYLPELSIDPAMKNLLTSFLLHEKSPYILLTA